MSIKIIGEEVMIVTQFTNLHQILYKTKDKIEETKMKNLLNIKSIMSIILQSNKAVNRTGQYHHSQERFHPIRKLMKKP